MLLMVLIELRLKLSESSSGLVLVPLGDVVATCALVSLLMMTVVMFVIAIALESVVARLGRYLLSGMSTTDSSTDSSTDSKSLSGGSGVSANAANGLGVLIVDAVGVTTFGVSFITPIVSRGGLLYILSNYAKE